MTTHADRMAGIRARLDAVAESEPEKWVVRVHKSYYADDPDAPHRIAVDDPVGGSIASGMNLVEARLFVNAPSDIAYMADRIARYETDAMDLLKAYESTFHRQILTGESEAVVRRWLDARGALADGETMDGCSGG